MIDIISIVSMVWLAIVVVLLVTYKIKVFRDKIELAYLLLKSQAREEVGKGEYERAKGIDIALVILEGEFTWLEH